MSSWKNKLCIGGGQPDMEVSWQVTGRRSDGAMLRHPFRPVEDKPQRERGTYLVPEVFGQPQQRAVEWVRHPQTMRQIKETRDQIILNEHSRDHCVRTRGPLTGE